MSDILRVRMGFLLISGLLVCGSSDLAHGLVLPGDSGMSIRVPEGANARVMEAADDLSRYLEKMFNKPFPLERGSGGPGILLGTVKDYPEFAWDLNRAVPGAKEGFVIKTEPQRLMLVGASPLGVQNAVWTFLHELGYRHYFPGERWEIIPQLGQTDLKLHKVSSPSFATRVIFFGFGTWPELKDDEKTWRRHNRLESGFHLHTGHAYGGIETRNAKVFAEHLEYHASPPGTPNNKFNVAEEGLRTLVIEDALARLEENPDLDSISMEPSDGGNWPESSPLGSVSNQALTLANEVAKALQEARPGVKVGLYAYNEHSPPPSIDVHPDVIVTVATAFIRGGYEFEELMAGWAERGATLGVRDYLGVWAWDRDLPGRPRAASPRTVAENIAKFYRLGARYYVAEANYGFGAGGLGWIVAARCLWDVAEAEKVDFLIDDFLSKAFRSTKEPMSRFYKLIDGDSSPLLSDQLLGGMYRALEEAYALASDADVQGRIDDLAAYTHYVELFRNYQNAEGAKRQKAFDVLADYAKRIRKTGMVHTWALLRDQPARDDSIDFQNEPKDFLVGIDACKAPLHKELENWVKEGIQRYDLLDFQPASFSTNLVPLTASAPSSADSSDTYLLRMRGDNSFYTYVGEEDGGSIRFSVSGGNIKSYNRGPVRIQLFPIGHPLGKSVAEVEVPADTVEREVELKSDYKGLHRISIDDGNNLTFVYWPEDLPLALPSGQENCVRFNARYSLYFYVPEGVESIAGYATSQTGEIVDPDGGIAYRFSEMDGPGYFQVPVPEGMSGKAWMLRNCARKRLLMTVPPYLAPSPEALLVPAETIGK